MLNDCEILSMCSSRARPVECKRMLESFDATKTRQTEIAVYISEKDKRLPEYLDFLEGEHWAYTVGPHKFLGEVLNLFSTIIAPEVKYYQEVNDDHIYQTIGWDDKLVKTIEEKGNGWGIAHPNKLNGPNDRSPSAYMMSGNLVRALGWFTLPGLRQNSIDAAIHALGTALNRIWYVEDCVIFHKNWKADQAGHKTGALHDANCDFVYSKGEEEHGEAVLKAHDFNADICKVQKAMK